MKKPVPEDYGFQSSSAPWEESGWMFEGGEEAFDEAMTKYDKEQNALTGIELTIETKP